MIELPVTWLLGVLGILATTIASLAGIIYSILISRLRAQDAIIDGLRKDVERMAKGCGIETCHWRLR